MRKRLVRTLTAFAVAVCSVAALAACSGGPGSGDVATTYPSGVASANRIISEYRSWIGVDGKRRDAIHQGIDIGGPFSQPIIAVADGRVIETHTDRCWGPTVAIDHGSDTDGQPLIALYGHVDDILVEEGQTVSRGDVVARLGNNHHGFRCIGGVRHLHLQLGRERRVNKGSYWGHTYFLRDGRDGLNPHLLWADGPHSVTCFEQDGDYPPGTIVYPVPCTN